MNKRQEALARELLGPLYGKLPPPSPEELEFKKYRDLYWEKFGESYGFAFGYYPEGGREEGIKDIKECLATGKRSEKPWMNPKYEEGYVY